MRPQNQHQNMLNKKDTATVTSPVEIKPVKIGDPKTRSKITFEVVTARVLESGGKKHVVCSKSMIPRLFSAIFRMNYCFLYSRHTQLL